MHEIKFSNLHKHYNLISSFLSYPTMADGTCEFLQHGTKCSLSLLCHFKIEHSWSLLLLQTYYIQKNYITNENEVLLIVETLQSFRSMLFGADIHVCIDHDILTHNAPFTLCVLCWHLFIEDFYPIFHFICYWCKPWSCWCTFLSVYECLNGGRFNSTWHCSWLKCRSFFYCTRKWITSWIYFTATSFTRGDRIVLRDYPFLHFWQLQSSYHCNNNKIFQINITP